MAEKKTESHKVGDSVKAKTVVRPESAEEVAVTGGLYVLDVPGEYVIDGEPVTVKK